MKLELPEAAVASMNRVGDIEHESNIATHVIPPHHQYRNIPLVLRKYQVGEDSVFCLIFQS